MVMDDKALGIRASARARASSRRRAARERAEVFFPFFFDDEATAERAERTPEDVERFFVRAERSDVLARKHREIPTRSAMIAPRSG